MSWNLADIWSDMLEEKLSNGTLTMNRSNQSNNANRKRVNKDIRAEMRAKYSESYALNKNAKVGTLICCPICGNLFWKKQYSQVFDTLKCKNTYWDRTKGDRHRK